jgi:hypothetical protein
MQQVACPSCGGAFKFRPEYEGRPASCPSCGARFIVESSPQPPPIISSYVAPRGQIRRKESQLLLASLISAVAFVAIGAGIYGIPHVDASQFLTSIGRKFDQSSGARNRHFFSGS